MFSGVLTIQLVQKNTKQLSLRFANVLFCHEQYKIDYVCRHTSVICNWFQSGFLPGPSLHSDHLSTPVSITPVLMDCRPILMSLQPATDGSIDFSATAEDWFQLFWWQLLCHCMCKISCCVGSLNEKKSVCLFPFFVLFKTQLTLLTDPHDFSILYILWNYPFS